MGVVGKAERRSQISVWLPTAIYAAFVFTVAWRHEPWADEAQAWLIARDSSLGVLWTRLLHYEGTPGAWHTLLWILQRAGMPYGAFNMLSAAFGTLAAYLEFRFAPFNAPIRLALPFTYFLAYQYAVVARSYVLLPGLLFGLAALYPDRWKRPALYALLLGVLCLCSLHGLCLAAAVAITTFRHRLLLLITLPAAFAAWAAWPAPDVTFVRHLNYSFPHFFEGTQRIFAEAFLGNWIVSLLAISATISFLWRGRGLWMFVLAASSLTLLMSVVYGQVWHFGTVLLAWVFALWISAARTEAGWFANLAMAALILVQVWWTAASSLSDLRLPYSAGLITAKYLKEQHLSERGIYGVGYASVAVQPYFANNIFTNFHHAYWDWSEQNHMIRDYDKLEDIRPEHVLVGYKTAQEDDVWNTLVRRAGYRRVRHFDAHIIWKGGALEPESFDLYERR